MIELFQDTVLWKVLTCFLSHPSTSFYVKQLSRELKISPSGTNRSLKLLAKNEILFKDEKANAHYYSLNNSLPFVKFLKVSYFLATIKEWKIEVKFRNQDENIISLAVYGSYASGDFDEKSDVDILLITPKPKNHFLNLINDIEKYLNREANLEVFTPSKWQNVKQENKTFYQETIRSHILLLGSELL